MNTKYYLSIFVAIGLLASCSSEPVKKKTESFDLTVDVAQVENIKEAELLSFTGKLEAASYSKLSTRIMGQVENIHVKLGETVRKGQLLLQISNKDILAKKKQAEANLKLSETLMADAEKNLERYQNLFDKKSASKKELEDMQIQKKVADAKLEAAKGMLVEVEESLKYANVSAPYSGRVTKQFVKVGDLASPGMPLLSIEKKGNYQVLARVPESEISQIKLNDYVEVELTAQNKRRLRGRVSEINPSAIDSGNQFEIKVQLDALKDSNLKLYTGMFAKVYIQMGETNRIVIPKSVLVERGQLIGVYTLSQSNTALLRWIRVGKTYGNSIEVLSGLSSGEKYIASYKGKIWDGAKLKVNNVK
ncbi:efflux RND transporter periplasmic adaptor subunit [Ancylomarina sp. 16SWW S1-10-2]|uniref:efflux RND transporter periplasmic adaptor subunit n=1 Tax=Ancylomarina sp. 16SWW S1-10-2 TaxID=2499681 RepID=UPI0012ADE517|nr:efflux RND transporter periplasmic adaptor subunit [Ancylomarina sp. 16SWW S1-10-2]MRT93541.1 efflux RND transporter periplasmic adaptor subunit [Ancylomarina sp. 16SWW S1-10-2]